MTVEAQRDHEPVVRRVPREDAVVVVRRALERADSGQPRFPGEETEARAAVKVLKERLKRLKARGIEFSDIELSVYVRQLLPGPGRMTMAS